MPWSALPLGGRGQGPYRGIVHFHKVFKGFLNKHKVLTISIRSALWGGMQKHKDFLWFWRFPLAACMHVWDVQNDWAFGPQSDCTARDIAA